jgi:hypothetical protein
VNPTHVFEAIIRGARQQEAPREPGWGLLRVASESATPATHWRLRNAAVTAADAFRQTAGRIYLHRISDSDVQVRVRASGDPEDHDAFVAGEWRAADVLERHDALPPAARDFVRVLSNALALPLRVSFEP